MKAFFAALQIRCAAALAAFRRRLIPAPFAALEVGTASWVSYALAAFCELRLADALAEAPRAAEDLETLGYGDAASLARLLRALSAYEIVRAGRDGRWRLARAGKALTGANSIAAMIRYANAAWHASGYHRLADGIKAKQPGFTIAQTQSLFAYLSTRPGESALFDAAMRGMNALVAQAFVDAIDFSRFATICDVGGGDGALMERVLTRTPHLQASVFDLPHVVAGATSQRVTFVAGDIFQMVPPRADCYVLSHVLHDWPDDACATILFNVRRAMQPDSRLFIYEMLADERLNVWSPDRISDLEMFAMLGGKERTRAQFDALLTAAGLKLLTIHRAAAPEAAIECAPAESRDR